MRINIVCFTDQGQVLADRLVAAWSPVDNVAVTRCGAGGPSLREWAAAAFAASDALVVIGAVGIAVRAIAPHLRSKTTDPAVVVVDDTARYAVSLLSGHIGGGNALANRVAAVLGAEAVVTTATDRNGLFAVDAWAAANAMGMRNTSAVKAVASTLLAGGDIAVYSEFPIAGVLPPGIVLTDIADMADMVIAAREVPTHAFHCIPPVVTAGMGCRKGVAADILSGVLDEVFERVGLCPESLSMVASINVKEKEPGLLALCQDRGVPFRTFSAEALGAVPGDFSPSDLVERTVGVDNVCERAAVLASGGRLLAGKWARDGVTVALATVPYSVDFGRMDG